MISPELFDAFIAVGAALGLFKGGEYGVKKYTERKNGNSIGQSNTVAEQDILTKEVHDKGCNKRLDAVKKDLEKKIDHNHEMIVQEIGHINEMSKERYENLTDKIDKVLK